MTEDEWLACREPEKMLGFLGNRASDRKCRCFVVACARRVLPPDPDAAMTEALEVAERYADGAATRHALTCARGRLKNDHPARVGDWSPLYTPHIRSVPAWYATLESVARTAGLASRLCAWSSTRAVFLGSVGMTYPDKELAAQAALLRDIFGPLRFRNALFSPIWMTSAVTSLATQMYESRDFTAAPILADALQDGGCCDEEILGHLRGGGPHVRGCWVVDAIIGKT